MHRPAAQLEQPGGIVDAQGAARRQRRIFAKRVARHELGFLHEGHAAFLLQHGDNRHADRHEAGLRILGKAQLVIGPFEHQAAQVLLKGIVDFFEDQTRRRKCLGEVAAHTDRLRPLAGKHKSTFHIVLGQSPLFRRAQ